MSSEPNSTGTGEAILEVEGLVKRFGRRGYSGRSSVADSVVAVDEVSLRIEQGETLGVVGESGSGKSTMAFCIAQLLRADAGTIRFRGVDLANCSREDLQRSRRDLQIVFQDPFSSLNPTMPVGSIIAEPLLVHKIGDRDSRRRRVEELLDMVGLPSGAARKMPREFSGGQRQRIAIARAIALEPRLIICDEPTSALDVSIQAQILNLLRALQDRLGLSYLFISHDLAVVYVMSDRIAVMKSGRIVETGAASAVYARPTNSYTQRLVGAAVYRS